VTPAPLIVLHGANGSAADMAPLLERLGLERPVLAPDMLGHGGRHIPDMLSVAALAEDMLARCDAEGIDRAHWFGYSVGGLVALWIAAHRPDRVLSVATLTTKFVYDEAAVAHAAHLANPERLLRSNPARAEALEKMHRPQDWRELIEVARRMFVGFADPPPIGREAIARIRVPLLAFGAMKDPMVSPGEVRQLAALVQHGVAALFPGTAHPLAQAPLETIAATLARFHADPARFTRAAKVTLRDYRWDRPDLSAQQR